MKKIKGPKRFFSEVIVVTTDFHNSQEMKNKLLGSFEMRLCKSAAQENSSSHSRENVILQVLVL